MPKKEIFTEIDERKIKLSNLDKVLFLETGIVKAELIQYYLKIAPFILPHLKQRPLTLIRYPDGVKGKRFYSKNKPSWTPEWIASTFLHAEDDNNYLLANDRPTLIWIANLAALELHTMQITTLEKHNPDHFIFDLDPPDNSNFNVVKQLAFRLKPFLESYGYQPFLKTSGSKGLHIYVPIIPKYPQKVVFETVKNMAQDFIKKDKVTTLKLNKEKRQGKVLLDIYRNHTSQTCVAPYSTRGKLGAPVSTPLHWEELSKIKTSQAFSIQSIFDKLEADGDPWQDFRKQQSYLHTDQLKTPLKASSSSALDEGEGEIASIDAISLKPMLATSGKNIPKKSDYFFEIKWDGIRVLIIKDNNRISIISRNGNDLTDKFPAIKKLIQNQPADSFIADGELVVMSPDGKPKFSKVVGRMHLKGSAQINKSSSIERATLYLFDLLYSEGKDIRKSKIEDRRTILHNQIHWDKYIKFSETFEDGKGLFEAIEIQGMEGIMCKKKGSKYKSDIRSKSWLKIKVQNVDHALIIGYTKGQGERSKLFGALHLAKKQNDEFVYLGKIGTGFSIKKMKQIKALLLEVKQIKKPISNKIEEERNSIWIEPTFSCKLKFASFSSNGTYREPVFIQMRKTSTTP